MTIRGVWLKCLHKHDWWVITVNTVSAYVVTSCISDLGDSRFFSEKCYLYYIVRIISIINRFCLENNWNLTNWHIGFLRSCATSSFSYIGKMCHRTTKQLNFQFVCLLGNLPYFMLIFCVFIERRFF